MSKKSCLKIMSENHRSEKKVNWNIFFLKINSEKNIILFFKFYNFIINIFNNFILFLYFEFLLFF